MIPLAQNKALSLEPVIPDDCHCIAEIYNSNPDFLKYHLAVSAVNEEWVRKEQEEMRSVSFCTAKLIDHKSRRAFGFFDYRLGEDAYLSLFMLDGTLKGSGLGTTGYRLMEGYFSAQGCRSVRIDVVYDYPANALGFWEHCGFAGREIVQLEWCGKRSNAYKMIKIL